MKTIKKIVILCSASLFFFGFSLLSDDNAYGNATRAFYIERSLNRNIVCYDLNIDESGVLNTREPIHVYWINREKHPGQRDEIKYFQQPAFGYKVSTVNGDIVSLKLNAMKNRPVSIERDSQQKYVCKTTIDGQLAILQKIYVKTRESNPLQVEYMDIFGVQVKNGASINERFKP